MEVFGASQNRGLKVIEILEHGVDPYFVDTKPAVQLVPVKSKIQLRDYQQEAFECILKDLSNHQSCLAVLATGLGKTILFAKFIEAWPGRVLVLVNREELLQNAYQEVGAITGEVLGIERGSEYSLGERIVIGTVQTLNLKLRSYKPGHFSLIICDEAHNCASEIYRRVFEHFRDAKRIGFTATDSRADGRRLPFEKLSYRMGIREGIEQGYLVPIQGKRVVIESIDLTRVRRTGNKEQGDFDDSALDEEMVKGAAAIADVIHNDYPFDKGILFFPGCASAKLTSEFINKRLPDLSVYIDGKITGSERRVLVNSLRSGKSNWLCNVGIATEGFNWPDAAVVGMCAPTLSRTAYVQRAGRGTRPLQGILNSLENASIRQKVIRKSPKPYMTILDFVGVSANLNLISYDTFTGSYDTSIEEIGSKRNSAGDIETIEEQERDITDEISGDERPRSYSFGGIASCVKSRTVHQSESFDPIDDLSEPAKGIKFPKAEAVDETIITEKQINLLAKYGIRDSAITRQQAQKCIGYIAQNKFMLNSGQKMILKKLYNSITGKV